MNPKIVGGVAGAALFLFFMTKPSREDFDQQVTYMLRSAIGSSSLSNKREVFSNVKSALSVSSTDYLVAAYYEASGAGTDIACWALLTRFACNGGVSMPATDSEPPLPSH